MKLTFRLGIGKSSRLTTIIVILFFLPPLLARSAQVVEDFRKAAEEAEAKAAEREVEERHVEFLKKKVQAQDKTIDQRLDP